MPQRRSPAQEETRGRRDECQQAQLSAAQKVDIMSSLASSTPQSERQISVDDKLKILESLNTQ